MCSCPPLGLNKSPHLKNVLNVSLGKGEIRTRSHLFDKDQGRDGAIISAKSFQSQDELQMLLVVFTFDGDRRLFCM